ncbi:MAG: sigma-70 family RNA polymerase sigma factor [Oscillospiraceae bacterium]|nr:sigma-70 family RNA polymerase sigma factor [Oscillospiraceae bacterium]
MPTFFFPALDTDNKKDLLEEIYSSNRKLMLRIAEGILKSGCAEDAVHNAFLRIAKNIEKFSSISCNERRCLCVTIVRNISIDMLRKSHRDKMIPWDEVNEPIRHISAIDEILRVERLSDIERCIGMLEPALRDVVDLCLVLEYNTRETAALLDISHEAVRTRLHRGRTKLKEMLVKEGITHV